MKILWLTNIIIPQIEKLSASKASNFGGWIVSLCDDILENKDIQLIVCSPHLSNNLIKGSNDNFSFYCFSKNNSKRQFRQFEEIIKNELPDVIQIFGTEYIHTLNMVNICEKLGMIDKVAIHIQGLVSIYSKHYTAFLPNNVVNDFTLRDLIRRDNIKMAQKRMAKRGPFEIEAISKVKHIIGRTDWDRACTSQINPTASYHCCNESLRGEFYNHNWKYENCERNSIFLSQCSYPIKGFHLMLEAMPLILKEYPDAKIYTTGKNLFNLSFEDKLKMNSYQKYIIEQVRKYKIEENIKFVGFLSEKQMIEQYLRANVFVSASSIENSPNSIGEAMLLGVPTISSDVGGVKNLMEHNKEGYVYQSDAPYMLAYYVCEIFRDKQLAQEFSKNGHEHALKTHNRENNMKTLLSIYKIMSKG